MQVGVGCVEGVIHEFIEVLDSTVVGDGYSTKNYHEDDELAAGQYFLCHSHPPFMYFLQHLPQYLGSDMHFKLK